MSDLQFVVIISLVPLITDYKQPVPCLPSFPLNTDNWYFTVVDRISDVPDSDFTTWCGFKNIGENTDALEYINQPAHIKIVGTF
ncbi:hypothetical protein LK03_02815 [Pseudomonas cremoricolorata]|uniref:Uncharacterized protein n=1 Tax=Pseudomonas cremoricolorata TaxID=157783 RepID=A0A089WI27_9PSED|nr:hypothetical protein LK03_02815 [Pseudomonas cremoricolorata]